jgi:glycosyltransferase involved in cell wall biosynthesis
MNRLRVAVVSDALYPWHKGGKEVRYLHLLEGLPAQGMDVVVYSMRWWSDAPDVVTTESGSLSYVAICPRVPMYRGSRRSLAQALLFAVSTLRLLTRDFDVIEADHMPYLQLLPLRVVAWVKRAPLVITWHEVWGREGWRSYLGRAGYPAALIERVCVKLPDEIIAVSPGTADKLVAMGAKQSHVHVVPNAVDVSSLLPSVEQEPSPELLFVGRLLEHKNAHIAVEATAILVERGYDVNLGIVGIGPEEARLQAQVVELGLDDRVKFFSNIESQTDLWSFIRGSRVLLAPSVREGFGLVVAESLALGTPVVCAVHPENESSKLVAPATGSLVEAFNAVALADGAEYWLNDDSPRAERISTFLESHRELSGHAMSSSYAEIFRSLDQQRRPHPTQAKEE